MYLKCCFGFLVVVGLILMLSPQETHQTTLLPNAIVAKPLGLPAATPIANVLAPLVNTIYNLVLSLLTALDTMPQQLVLSLPIDIQAFKLSLLNLYLESLKLLEFFTKCQTLVLFEGCDETFKVKLGVLVQALTVADVTAYANPLLDGLLQIVLFLVNTVFVIL